MPLPTLELSVSSITESLKSTRHASYESQCTSYILFAIPSFLYFVNNLLYLVGLRLTTPALLHVAILAKLPFTAVLHHLIIRRQRDSRVWASLVTICMGLLVSSIPLSFSRWMLGIAAPVVEPKDDKAANILLGSCFGLAVATISAFTSTFTEVLLKQKVPYWVAQWWLYLFGSLFSAAGLLFWDGKSSLKSGTKPSAPVLEPVNSSVYAVAVTASVVAITAAAGLVVANILRKKDNLVKLVGTSASVVTILVAQVVLFPDLRHSSLRVSTVLGTGIVAISTWIYYFYKLQSDQRTNQILMAALDLDDEEEVEGDLKEETSFIQPLRVDQDELDIPKPSKLRLLAAGGILILLSGLSGAYEAYLPAAQHRTSALMTSTRDVDQFFRPHNKTPSTWGQTETSHTCISEWVDRVYVSPDSAHFVNWEVEFLDSGCPVYPIPDSGFIFHQYWNGPWRPFLEVSIEAWLAKQRLGDGHRLIYWYNGPGPTAAVRFKFKKYARYVEFREFDMQAEAEGTCVEDMPEWQSEDYRQSNDMALVALSDIIRNLLLSKYGGIWIDADTIPMKDLTPMIRSGPSAGGLNSISWNNNVLVFGPADTNVTRRIMEVTCSLTTNQTLYIEREGPNAIMPLNWNWLWNDALFQICAARAHCGIGRLPIMFNDGWVFLGPGQPAMRPCEDDQQDLGAGALLPPTLRTLFNWHARFGQYDDACVDPGRKTVAGAVRRRIYELLANGGIDMGGRDLFPGPAYVG